MKGIIARLAAAACVVGGLAGLTGCNGYRDVVDPCYPQRYNWQAQNEVCEPFGTQVNNGHILDQTIWNSFFEQGKAKLTRGGLDRLDQLVRVRPHPDPVIYLQTANDIPYIPEAPVETYVQARRKLDAERIDSVQKYLAAQTAGRNLTFQVYVHNPAQPYIPASGELRSFAGYQTGFSGSLGGGSSAGGGTAPTAGSGGPSGTTTP